MQTTIFAGCRGNCEQGRRECTEDGGCFILPAEAATEVGADQPRIPRDRDMGCITGLLVSACATLGLVALGSFVAAVWP